MKLKHFLQISNIFKIFTIVLLYWVIDISSIIYCQNINALL